jgi:two-component system chemotaxis response regulator CheB
VWIDPAQVHHVLVIGGSAGAFFPLQSLLADLPAAFPLPILIVQHLPGHLPSPLPELLGSHTHLRVQWAIDQELMKPGTVYIAPPDRHLFVRQTNRIGLSCANKVGFWRPAVDVLFESAADIFGERTIGIVLSGMMWDGARGIAAIAKRGGITIVQDEATSAFFEMPAAALDQGGADLIMSPTQIARALQILTENVAGRV